MNIFYLHRSPKICAEMHCDKHVVKMILESGQMLSTAHRVLDGEVVHTLSKNNRKIKKYRLENTHYDNLLYQACHVNHPSSVWVRESEHHYSYLMALFYWLNREYKHRYNNTHATYLKLHPYLNMLPLNIKKTGRFTPPPQAMPDEYKDANTLVAYRTYYMAKQDKFKMVWTRRKKPDWFLTKDDLSTRRENEY